MSLFIATDKLCFVGRAELANWVTSFVCAKRWEVILHMKKYFGIRIEKHV